MTQASTQDSALESPETEPNTSRWTLGLVSAGHFLSHFYGLVLPPLFPFLKAEFDVSYIELGLAMTAYGLLGGVVQAPVGFLVDRVGPRQVLLVGLGLNVVAIGLMGLADSYAFLLALAVLAGLGNSVFHPADYAILNHRVPEQRLGRAFAIHTFSGFLGGACAPITVLLLTQWTNWRTALIISAIVGLVVLAAMTLLKTFLVGGEPAPATPNDEPSERSQSNASSSAGSPADSGLRLLLSAPVMLFLMFFVLYGMCSGGLIAFTVTGLTMVHDLSLADANTALSGHLFGVVGGIFLAGMIVDRYPRHLVTATIALLGAATATALVLASPSQPLVLIVLLVLVGVGLGAVLPARDLMIRALTPPGQVGKVFGFVFVGYSVGVSAAPILFGWFLDAGQPDLLFVFAALFALAALAATAGAQHMSKLSIPPKE